MKRTIPLLFAAVIVVSSSVSSAAVATPRRPADSSTSLPGLSGNKNGVADGGQSIDPASLERLNAYDGGVGSHVQRLNALGNTVDKGGNNGGGGNNNNGNNNGNPGNSGTLKGLFGESIISESAAASSSRMHSEPQAPQGVSAGIKAPIESAKAALAMLPATARNYLVSIAYTPETQSQGAQALKAIEALSKMSEIDAKTYFSLPGLVNDSQRVIFYRSRIQKLSATDRDNTVSK